MVQGRAKRLFLCLLFVFGALFSAACDKLFVPGDVPDKPPDIYVLTESGEEIPAVRFGYSWTQVKSGKSEIADSISPLAYEFDPIPVKAGEILQILFDKDHGAPIFSVVFYTEGSEEAVQFEYERNIGGEDPRFAENSVALFPAEESGIFVVNGAWPSWYNDGIDGEAVYAFAVSVGD